MQREAVEAYHLPGLAEASWLELMPGDSIVMVDHKKQQIAGTVDTIDPDGSVLWVLLRNGNERRLFLPAEVSRTLADFHTLERRYRAAQDSPVGSIKP